MTCPPAEIQPHADGLMRRRRWAEAAALLAQLESRDQATEMKRCLSANLAAMQTFRPSIYQQLITLPATSDFGIAASASGRPTVLAKRADGTVVSLAGGSDPLAAATCMLAQVRGATPNGESVALCGLGDGYLLGVLAKHPPALFMDTEQAVFVLEPQPQVLLHVLMIHDFSATDGPIAAERFRWFVGPDYVQQLDEAVEREPSIGVPGVTLQQGLDAAAVQAQVQASLKMLGDRDARSKREIDAYYATMSPDHLASLFGERPPRQPRVILLTTRFSTVLQHSTRDTADAFRQLGWDARVLIEPSPSHRLFQHAIRAAVADFKPDLLFQIDHLRQEHGGLFPPNLPFVCWGQDHLPNLITPDAGRRVSPLDFVLTDNPIGYAKHYAYPARQLISTPKLTTVSAAPLVRSESNVEDIVFVSNASKTPALHLEEIAGDWDGTGVALDVLMFAAQVVLNAYAAGNAVSTYGEVRRIVAQAASACGVRLAADELLSVCKWITHPFNDALYRQQSLTWATNAAARRGLTVGLYGKGWESNPEFAAHARGTVGYGDALRDLTRRAAINLQIVPYLCLHQRLLDGLAAGGFFVVRENPNDVYPQQLLNFVREHAGDAARTTTQVRRAIGESHAAELESLLASAADGTVSGEGEDVVELIWAWAEAGNLETDGTEVLPRLSEVSFDSEAEFGTLLDRFARSSEQRAEIATQQRAAVVRRLSHTAGIARVQRRIAELLSETAGVRKCA